MHNALTIDVEDYFMVSAFADIVSFEDWHRYESRIENNTYKVLDLLDEYGVKATFFVLGWVAEHYPEIVGDIHGRGHEIACHGYNHRLVYKLSPAEFREDIGKSRTLIEDITGEPVLGYRAASYSIIKDSLWALDILIEEGFVYDSSIFPVHHDRYGIPNADRFCHEIRRPSGTIREFPMSTLKFRIQNSEFRIPIAGGGYLRLLPARFIEWGIRRLNEKEKQPAVLYLHPWEFDNGQPRLKGSRLSVFRHYVNLDTTESKLRRILESFSFAPVREVFGVTTGDKNESPFPPAGAGWGIQNSDMP